MVSPLASPLRHVFAAATLWLAAAGGLRAEEVKVFAAASLQPALNEIKPLYEAATGDRLTLVFAGTSTLARQIGQGAPADVFISANAAWMDALEEGGHFKGAERVDLLTNALVIIAAEPAGIIPLNLIASAEGRIAMALTEAVPSGIYAREALENMGVWDALAPRVVETDNVRAALALVLRGEAAFGVVYRSDAASEPRVAIVNILPAEAHGPVTYPAAALGNASEAAAGFLRHLQGHEASAIFRSHGFGLASERAE